MDRRLPSFLRLPHFCYSQQLTSAVSVPSDDLWSLGVIAFYMLVARLPFEKASEFTPQDLKAPPLFLEDDGWDSRSRAYSRGKYRYTPHQID